MTPMPPSPPESAPKERVITIPSGGDWEHDRTERLHGGKGQALGPVLSATLNHPCCVCAEPGRAAGPLWVGGAARPDFFTHWGSPKGHTAGMPSPFQTPSPLNGTL